MRRSLRFASGSHSSYHTPAEPKHEIVLFLIPVAGDTSDHRQIRREEPGYLFLIES